MTGDSYREELNEVRRILAELAGEIKALKEQQERFAGTPRGGSPQRPTPQEPPSPPRAPRPPRRERGQRGEIPDQVPVVLEGVKAMDNGRFVSLVCYWREGGGQMLSHSEETWEGLRDVSEVQVAQFMSPFSSEQRIGLLKALAEGSQSAGELAEETGLSSGQLYHHLRELASARYLLSPERNSYELTLRGKRALLTVLGLAKSLGSGPVEPNDEGVVIEELGFTGAESRDDV